MKMKPITLDKLAEVTGGRYIGPMHRRFARIEGVTTDSRAVAEGDLFVCIRGARADGHAFARKAAQAGAVCRLAEEELRDGYPYVLVESTLEALKALAEWYRRLFRIPIVGVIGSVGKTTTKELTAAVLGRKYAVHKTPANMNNELGVPLTLLGLREEHEAAVVEMGISDFGEMRRLAKMVRPDIVIFTGIGYCHLERLGDLNGVLRAKSEVFEYMAEDALAVLNGDDALLRDFHPHTRRITYGGAKENDYRAERVESLGFDGVSCDIVGPGLRIFTLIPAFGTHIVYGALAAAAVARELGVPEEDILRGLADYRPVGGRAQVIDTGTLTLINDCYNANPNSMAAAIRSLSSLRALSGKTAKRVAILGDMMELGVDAPQLHRAMGILAAEKGIDLVLAVGADARYIYEGCADRGGRARYYRTREELFSQLEELVGKGDVVLVKASHSMGFEDIVDRLRRVRS